MHPEVLPIDASLPEVVAKLKTSSNLVLSAAPGSGKTTRVPAALLDAGIDGQILVLEPRRLAARAAARRVAWERSCELGDLVGFQVRHQKRVSKRTRLVFMTEGVLLRMILADPFLEGVSAVVLDEFHERHLEGDLGLAMLREIQETVRPDLRVLVMSATLEMENLRAFLGDCAEHVVASESYPVELVYMDRSQRGELQDLLRSQLRRALEESTGDILVFLPGMREIRAAARGLEDLARRAGCELLPLHGSLSPEEQDHVLLAANHRKIVLATNLAESSLTIPGVTAVIDSGLARVLRHDPGRGLDLLRVEAVSMASAQQRAGRAGRTAAGFCYRLWSKAEERARPAHGTPEIKRVDLAGPALQVRAFAGRPPAEFRWFEAPDAAGLSRADQLLAELGAVEAGQVSAIGREMLRLPLHPRLARMILEARRLGCHRSAAAVAAILSERDIRRPGAGKRSVDIDDLLAVMEIAASGRSGLAAADLADIDRSALKRVLRVHEQIADGAAEDREPDALGRAILAAFPDRLLRLRAPGSRDGVMVGGRGLGLVGESSWTGELLIALATRDQAGPGSRALVDLVSPVEPEWLEELHPDALEETQDLDWDESGQRIRVLRQLRFRDLVLEQGPGDRPDPERVAALLEARIAEDPCQFLDSAKELQAFLARLSWLRREAPDLELPSIGNPEIARLTAQLGSRFRSLKDLRKLKVLPSLRSLLDPSQHSSLDRMAPERVSLPSGRRARIDYSAAEPCVAARIQELFGLAEAPRLPAGRRPLLLHLLGPNQRPVQITGDLASFWRQIYPSLRIEMKRRYPRHAWPEDPLAAQPEAGPKRRRSP